MPLFHLISILALLRGRGELEGEKTEDKESKLEFVSYKRAAEGEQ